MMSPAAFKRVKGTTLSHFDPQLLGCDYCFAARGKKLLSKKHLQDIVIAAHPLGWLPQKTQKVHLDADDQLAADDQVSGFELQDIGESGRLPGELFGLKRGRV